MQHGKESKIRRVTKELRAGIASASLAFFGVPLAAGAQTPQVATTAAPATPAPLNEGFNPKDPRQARLVDAILALHTPLDKSLSFWRQEAERIMAEAAPERRKDIRFLDPLEYVYAEALGIRRKEYAFATLVEKDGITPEYAELFAGDFYRNVTPSAENEWTPAFNMSARVMYRASGQSSILIVPSFLTLPAYSRASGLSTQEKLDFTNYHEIYHPLNRLWDSKDTNASQRREIFADLGAVGEMMMRGHGENVIRRIMQWRQASGRDIDHITQDGLKMLLDYIDKNGRQAFLGLPTEQKMRLYEEISDKTAMPAAVFSCAHYATDNKLTLDDRAQAGNQPLRDALQVIARQTYNLAPLQPTGAREQLAAWDPVRELNDMAARSGKITPLTLLAAGNDLLQQLDDAARAEPNNFIPRIKTARAVMALTGINDQDLVKLNAARGLTLSADDLAEIDIVRRNREHMRIFGSPPDKQYKKTVHQCPRPGA